MSLPCVYVFRVITNKQGYSLLNFYFFDDMILIALSGSGLAVCLRLANIAECLFRCQSG